MTNNLKKKLDNLTPDQQRELLSKGSLITLHSMPDRANKKMKMTAVYYWLPKPDLGKMTLTQLP